MSDQDDRLTRTEVARLIGMTEGAIRWHIKAGNITPGSDGKLSHADADTLRRMANVRKPRDPRAEKLLKVRVLGGAIKTKRIKLSLRDAKAQTVERAPLEAALRVAAREIIARVQGWPDRYGSRVAQELNTDLATAKAVLRRFSTIALTELGDIEAEALRCLDPP